MRHLLPEPEQSAAPGPWMLHPVAEDAGVRGQAGAGGRACVHLRQRQSCRSRHGKDMTQLERPLLRVPHLNQAHLPSCTTDQIQACHVMIVQPGICLHQISLQKMEVRGIHPRTSRMLSKRSTI